jgi:uncharacterized membrane protein YheB (UPF0754 family)
LSSSSKAKDLGLCSYYPNTPKNAPPKKQNQIQPKEEKKKLETFLFILKLIAGPVLGAVIGYFTNWLAVKMLFRPYYPKKIGKFTLPFTPGIIPKRKQALAQAVGKAVGEQLFTKDDIKAALSTEETKQAVVDYALESVHSLESKSVSDVASSLMTEDRAASLAVNAEGVATDKIYAAVQRADIGGIVVTECKKFVAEKKSSLGMVAMFLTDGLVDSLAEKLRGGVDNYIQNNGRELIETEVKKELKNISTAPLSPIVKSVDDQIIASAVGKLYDNVMDGGLTKLLENIDVQGIVENKLNEMDVKDLEKLVMSVMKKELGAIVNLGALIGFLLGIIMDLIQFI